MKLREKTSAADNRNLRSGQVVILTAVSLIFILSIIGLSVDLGYAYYQKEAMRIAADSAASAAAIWASSHADSCSTISCNSPLSCTGVATATNALQAGCVYANANAPGSATSTVTANNTVPPGITGNAPGLWFKASVQGTYSNKFLYVAGFTGGNVGSSSVSGVTSVGPPYGACIFALGTTGTVFSQTGSGDIDANCGVYVNANAVLNNTGKFNASFLKYYGTYTLIASQQVVPVPQHVSVLASDPLAYVTQPTVANSCAFTAKSVTSTTTLSPGVYCNGLSITGGTVTLNPGVYIINGGALTLTGGTLTGTGVTFFMTSKNGQPASGVLTFTGSGSHTLTAPTSGSTQGVLFYQDPAATATPNIVNITGGTLHINGSYYFPNSELRYAATHATNYVDYVALVAKIIQLTQDSNFQQDTTGTKTGLARTLSGLIY